MTNKLRATLILTASTFFMIGVIIGPIPTTPADADDATHSTRIEEDDPRWDCATMGNRKIGRAHV